MSNKYIISYSGKNPENFDKFITLINSDEDNEYHKKQWLISQKTYDNILKEIPLNELDFKGEDLSSLKEDNEIGKDLKLKLFPYQKEVVRFCLSKNKAIIVLPCGSGKTPIGIDTFIDAKNLSIISESGKGLIVVKSSLKIQWSKEIEKFSNLKASLVDTYKSVNPYLQAKIRKLKKKQEPYLKNAMYYASELEEIENEIRLLEEKIETEFNAMFDEKNDLFIANYETLRDSHVRQRLHKLNLEYVFADEIHYIKNSSSSRSKALYEFADVKLRFGATATPIQKNPLDAYGICRFISPDTFKSESSFKTRYLVYSGFGRVSGSKNEQELNKKLSDFMIVKEKEEVSAQLPSLVVVPRYCALEQKQIAVTEQILEEIKELKEQERNLIANSNGNIPANNEELLKIQANIMARQTFASELAVTEELLTLSDSNLAKKFVTGSKSNKIELLLDLIEEITESNEKVALFSKYRRLQPILTKAINERFSNIKIAYISGSLSSEERYTEAYTKFRDNDEYKVLIMSDAGVEGINLSKCKYLIEIEPADSYMVQTQRRGRIERADSLHTTVFVYQLIAEKSYDEISLKIIDKKERYDAAIIKGNL